MDIIAGLVSSAFLAAGVLALAGLGETISQRAGVFNLGIEGFMAIGGISAIASVEATESLAAGSLAALAAGLVMGLFFALATVIFRVNQVISGLAFAFLGLGLSAWLGASYAGRRRRRPLKNWRSPGLETFLSWGKPSSTTRYPSIFPSSFCRSS